MNGTEVRNPVPYQEIQKSRRMQGYFMAWPFWRVHKTGTWKRD